MATLKFGNSNIDYRIEYKSNKKDVTVSIDWNNGVKVVAPPTITQERLDSILLKKAPWILKKQFEFDEIQEPKSSLEFLSGEKIQYLGKRYKLKVERSKSITVPKLSYSNGKFTAEIPISLSTDKRTSELQRLCIEWYKTRGLEKIQERINIYSSKMELIPIKLVLKDQELRWGSCTNNGTILINWRIMMAPMRIVDYVVVHEMAHLRYPDHSEVFWRYLSSILPDYEVRKEWLRIFGPTLFL